MMKTEALNLVQEWDKTFPKSDKVNHSKVTFVNHFGITLAADMYVPKDTEGKLPAIAVSGPFGACKESADSSQLLLTLLSPANPAASLAQCIPPTSTSRTSRQQ